MSEAEKRESGAVRFGRFRDMLREHGFVLQCSTHVRDKTSGLVFEQWIAMNRETGRSRLFVVVVGKHGFDLFSQSEMLMMQDDVAALVWATGGDPGE